jgi:hypothetical protein
MLTHVWDAVVLINQVTTKFVDKGLKSFLAPALGDTWAHACTSRVMLYWDQGQRYACLYKSPSRKSHTVAYCVTADGVSAAPPCSLPLSHWHSLARAVVMIEPSFIEHLFIDMGR